VALHTGTSGWAYKEWKGSFYPERLPQKRMLGHYASVLNSCEVNATFYRVQPPSVAEGWAGSVPDGFRFAVKAHRMVTYRKRITLELGRQWLGRFLDPLQPLLEQGKLGCLLLQFPPYVEADEQALQLFLGELPPGLPFACELRNEGWAPDIDDLVAHMGGTICITETEGEAPDSLPPGPVAYVRLKGDRYPDAAREGWRALLQAEAEGREVYAFAKHKGVPADDPHTGPGLARWLLSR
jgi:uncharacterized protein YecE (DUF72 family)